MFGGIVEDFDTLIRPTASALFNRALKPSAHRRNKYRERGSPAAASFRLERLR
jgi:hypothetical protein